MSDPIDEKDFERLYHMREYAQEVISFTEDQTQESLEADMLRVRALSYSIGIIGEAASKVGDKFRSANPQIPWAKITGMRNFLFHTYFRVDIHILWQTAIQAVPELIVELDKILPEEDTYTES